MLFASPEPLSRAEIAERLPGADVAALIEVLIERYADRGVNVRTVAGKVQMVTAPDCADVLVAYRTEGRRLSRAALETLSIIAYHQPCSRAEIEEVRGVAVAKGSLDQLLELGWIKLSGRRDAPGRPLLYATTDAFLEQFGLDDVSHLPGRADLEAQGLLDARLPPGFAVPSPRAVEGELTGEDAADAPDFVTDYDGEAG
nr:SMC-Scp complex subunit ScpB [Parvularcula dongshanensis]